MFIYCWEENDHVSSTVFFPIGCRTRKSLFICIKLKDSELCGVAGHAPSGRQWSLSLVSPEIASSPLKWMGSCRSLCRWVSLVVWTGLNASVNICCRSSAARHVLQCWFALFYVTCRCYWIKSPALTHCTLCLHQNYCNYD